MKSAQLGHCLGNPADGTGTVASRKPKFASYYVIAIDDPDIAEQEGLTDSSSTQRLIGNMLQ